MKYTVQFGATQYKYAMYFLVNTTRDCSRNQIIAPVGGQTVEARIGYYAFFDLSGFNTVVEYPNSGPNCFTYFTFSCSISG